MSPMPRPWSALLLAVAVISMANGVLVILFTAPRLCLELRRRIVRALASTRRGMPLKNSMNFISRNDTAYAPRPECRGWIVFVWQNHFLPTIGDCAHID